MQFMHKVVKQKNKPHHVMGLIAIARHYTKGSSLEALIMLSICVFLRFWAYANATSFGITNQVG